MEATREDDGQSNDRHSDAEDAIDRELLCPICLALLHRPAILDQCQHRFCAPCLIRLDRAGIQTCPVCWSDFEDWQLDEGNISPKVKRINILTKYAFFQNFITPLQMSTRMSTSRDNKLR